MSFYGIGQWFYSTQFPDDWLPCNGALIPSEYTAAKAVLGNYMPDLRNRFLRVRDSQNIGLTEEDTFKSHTHIQDAHTHIQNQHRHHIYYDAAASGAGTNSFQSAPGNTSNSGYATATNQSTIAVNQNTGDTETRPKSVYMSFVFI